MTESDLSVFDFDGDADADQRGPSILRAALKKRKDVDELWEPSRHRARTPTALRRSQKSSIVSRTRSKKSENAGGLKHTKGVLPVQTHRNSVPVEVESSDDGLIKERKRRKREEHEEQEEGAYQRLRHYRMHSLVFPPSDPDAVTISDKDIETLRPSAFLNDTIIDFYIKFLQTTLTPDEQRRTYFFNSFFFTKLAEADVLTGDEAKAAFLRLEKWTKDVDFSDKEFILLPVNQSLHWSLLIICNGDGAFSIIHLDSMGGYHSSIEACIKRYTVQVLAKSGSSQEDLKQVEFIKREVPQQDNAHDCGLFLLHYVELFLKQAFSFPRGGKILPFITRDWFEPNDASAKRRHILNLLNDLYVTAYGVPESSNSQNSREEQGAGSSIWVDEEDLVCV